MVTLNAETHLLKRKDRLDLLLVQASNNMAKKQMDA
jgi:hypothetical protein